MRDPQLVSIEFHVAQMSRQIFCNSGKSFEDYVHRFSHEIYFESKRRNSVEREMLIDTAIKHGFDEEVIQVRNETELTTDVEFFTSRPSVAVQAVQ